MTGQREAFQAAVEEAAAHIRAGETAAAEAAYRRALDSAPGHPIVLHNLGVMIAARGDEEGALACFDAAIAAEPHYASAYYNRAVALIALGRAQEALEALVRTVDVEPTHYEAHRALGFLWLAAGARGRSLDHFAFTYDLRRGENRTGIATRSLTHANRTKFQHDAAQFRYLAGDQPMPNRYALLAHAYEAIGADFPEEVTELTEAQLEELGDGFYNGYNTAIKIADAPELRDGAVAPRPDRDELTRLVGEGGSGAAYFDDLLTPKALAELRRYLLESTIWHDFSHIGGYVASYLEDGLACPLILQIADELRAAFPELLGTHPLSQAWAFKGVTSNAMIDVHADDAAYSVNFWITPDEANLEPGKGGMRICLEPPPADWTVDGYDSGVGRAVLFLEQNREKMLEVPYRENRATLFRSRLLHVSDTPNFDQAYENTRINLTLLFGRAGD